MDLAVKQSGHCAKQCSVSRQLHSCDCAITLIFTLATEQTEPVGSSHRADQFSTRKQTGHVAEQSARQCGISTCGARPHFPRTPPLRGSSWSLTFVCGSCPAAAAYDTQHQINAVCHEISRIFTSIATLSGVLAPVASKDLPIQCAS